MNRSEIYPKLKTLVTQVLQLPDEVADKINEDTDLINELGMNSIDALEFLVIVEKEFSITIDDEDLGADLVKTLGNLCDYLLQKSAS